MSNIEKTVETEELRIASIDKINYGFGVRIIGNNCMDSIVIDDDSRTITIYRNLRIHSTDNDNVMNDFMVSISLFTNEILKGVKFVRINQGNFRASDFKNVALKFKNDVYDILRDSVVKEYDIKKLYRCFSLTLEQYISGYRRIYLFEKRYTITLI